MPVLLHLPLTAPGGRREARHTRRRSARPGRARAAPERGGIGHRSRVGVILIDHSEGYDEAETFWARATGGTPQVQDPPEGFTVLEDPAGLVFCVVGVQTGERFDAEAVTWE